MNALDIQGIDARGILGIKVYGMKGTSNSSVRVRCLTELEIIAALCIHQVRAVYQTFLSHRNSRLNTIESPNYCC